MKSLQDLMRLDGRVALITGGAGHLGQAMGDALAELGCALCLVDTDAEGLNAAVAQLRENWGVPVWACRVDLEDQAARRELPAWIQGAGGRLDILINNAAFVGSRQLDGWVAAFEEQSLETWRRCLEVNLSAAFDLSQVFAPLLRASGQGTIVNVASIYGVVGPDLGLYEGTPMGNPAAYAASKGGLLQLTRWLATVLAPQIRVNCISPGGVFREQAETFTERYVRRTPLARMACEEDFKGSIAYLASELSAYVTGQNLIVDGGWTVW